MVHHVFAHHEQERNKTDETISSAVLFLCFDFLLVVTNLLDNQRKAENVSAM